MEIFALTAIGAAIFLAAKNSNNYSDVENQDTSAVPSAADNNPNTTATTNTTLANIGQYSLGQKIAAFQHMIQSCEHLYPTDVLNGAAYNLAYGQQWFNDMSDHPAVTGDMELIVLPDNFCIAAGLSPGCHSSAAGAYQIRLKTWQELQSSDP